MIRTGTGADQKHARAQRGKERVIEGAAAWCCCVQIATPREFPTFLKRKPHNAFLHTTSTPFLSTAFVTLCSHTLPKTKWRATTRTRAWTMMLVQLSQSLGRLLCRFRPPRFRPPGFRPPGFRPPTVQHTSPSPSAITTMSIWPLLFTFPPLPPSTLPEQSLPPSFPTFGSRPWATLRR